jgi:hypothetical protein
LPHAFRWEYSYKRLQLAQLLGQLGVFLTFASAASAISTQAHWISACSTAPLA